MKTFFIAVRALLYSAGFVLFWGWIALSVRPFDRSLGVLLPGWTKVPGKALMVMGGMIVLTCVGVFIERGRGTPAPFDAPRQFVAIGPYKYVRNPIYIGGLIVLMGFGLYQHSTSILLLSLFWFGLVHMFVVYFEEPNLKDKFGGTYETYRNAVPRWIPRS